MNEKQQRKTVKEKDGNKIGIHSRKSTNQLQKRNASGKGGKTPFKSADTKPNKPNKSGYQPKRYKKPPEEPKKPVKIIPLGGLGEIGKNIIIHI